MSREFNYSTKLVPTFVDVELDTACRCVHSAVEADVHKASVSAGVLLRGSAQPQAAVLPADNRALSLDQAAVLHACTAAELDRAGFTELYGIW